MKHHALLLLGLLILPGCSTIALKKLPANAGSQLSKPAEADLYLGIVDGLIAQNRYQAAIAFLEQYGKSEKPSPRYRQLLGDALAGAGRYDEAISAYRTILKSTMAARAYDGIGRAESAMHRWGNASDDFRRATTLDPANANYLNNFGYAQMKQDFRGARLGPAMVALERAHELAPGSHQIRANLILAAARFGDQARLQTLLNEITNAGQRQHVAAFAEKWNPVWGDDTGWAKAGTP
jgi:tetratricopeptide (TPR) repeat protein